MTSAGSYKNRNKPLPEHKTRYKQGYFTVPEQFQHKYVGDLNNIIYRSSLEYKFLLYCSYNPNITKFGSEIVHVKYLNPVANLKYNKQHGLSNTNPRNWKLCNYWIDFWVEVQKADGTVKKILVEIKPHAETLPPKPTSDKARIKNRRAFIRQSKIFLENKAKWQAADKWAKENGMEFKVVTDKIMKEMGIL